MMSQAISPTFMANLARMVAQQLQQSGVANQFQTKPAFLGPENHAIVTYGNNSNAAQLNSRQQFIEIDDTPRAAAIDTLAPSIRRTFSASSTSSLSASPNLGEDDDDVQMIVPPPLPKALNDRSFECFSGKNKKAKFYPEDKVVVNDPVMEALDPLFLAPLKSPLFKHKRVKTPDANGFRRFKKNADIDIELFKGLTKETIRRLLALAKERSPNLRQRYFYAALAVTTKRRANHIQSWRLYGGPLPFCYGGYDLYVEKYGEVKYTHRTAYKIKGKRSTKASSMSANFGYDEGEGASMNKIKGKRSNKASSMSANFSDNESDDEGEGASMNKIKGKRSTKKLVSAKALASSMSANFSDDEVDDEGEGASMNKIKGKRSTKKLASAKALASSLSANDNDDEDNKERCLGCGKFFVKKTMFPKSDREFKAEQDAGNLRCNFCWQTLIKNKILPEMNSSCMKVEKAIGKENCQTSRKCKCGSTTHKTANSRMCPLNKRYNTGTDIKYLTFQLSFICLTFFMYH